MRASRAGVADVIVIIFVGVSLAACCAGWYLYQVAERNRHYVNRLGKRAAELEADLGELAVQAKQISLHAGEKSEGLPSTKPIEDMLTPIKAELKLAGSDQTLQDALGPLEGKVYAAEIRLGLMTYNRDMAKDARDETKARLAGIESGLSKEMDRLKGRFDEFSKQLSDEGNAFAEHIDTMTQDETKKREEAVAISRKYADEQMRTKNETARLEQELQHLQQREALVRDVTRTAGKIVFADRYAKYAYIDLGSDASLREGMKFVVYRLGKGGVRQDKGEVEVKHIYDDQTQVSITRQNAEYDPIIEGDLIENPFYAKDKPRVVVLIGNFNQRDFRYAADELKARIARTGAIIEDKVTIHTDYVIVGTEIDQENDANYKQAAILSVPNVPMERLLGYLGD